MTHTPVETVQQACKAGTAKQNLRIGNLFLRAFMGGLLIAAGAALASVCSTGIQTPGIRQLVLGCVFPIGLIAIVLTGMDLFTGDCMFVPLSILSSKTCKSPVNKIGYVWTLSYIGNLIGSLFWAYIMFMGPFQSGTDRGFEINNYGIAAIQIAVAKTLTYKSAGLIGWCSCFLKGIACNMLVNIAILLGITSKNTIGKIIGIWFPIMAFVSTGFEHSIANMYFIPVAMLLLYQHPNACESIGGLVQSNGGISVADFIVWNLAPATLGNIIGGAVFIGLVYYYIFKDDIHNLEKDSEDGKNKNKSEKKEKYVETIVK